MKTKLIICQNQEDMLQGLGIIATLYKALPEEDGHKIFLTNRGSFYTLTNCKPDVTPPDDREIIFCTEEPLDLLKNRKHVDAQLSIAKITRSKNSEYTCQKLIDWLLCKIHS